MVVLQLVALVTCYLMYAIFTIGNHVNIRYEPWCDKSLEVLDNRLFMRLRGSTQNYLWSLFFNFDPLKQAEMCSWRYFGGVRSSLLFWVSPF